jgi:hypothetical protein
MRRFILWTILLITLFRIATVFGLGQVINYGRIWHKLSVKTLVIIR